MGIESRVSPSKSGILATQPLDLFVVTSITSGLRLQCGHWHGAVEVSAAAAMMAMVMVVAQA